MLLATLGGFATAAVAATLTYILAVRPWHLRWGASDAEVDLSLPGDDLVPEAKLKATHAISIQASPTKIWPWLVQIGQGRGGFYSYDWLENSMGLDIHTVNEINPEFQNLKVGDVIPLAPDGFGIPVAILESEKSLVLHGDTRLPGPGKAPEMKEGDHLATVWGFHLFPQADGNTRRVERIFIDWNETPVNNFFYRVFLEPGSFIMEQKMLCGIKERAENSAA
ncbi:MAG TPA: hypothetical protein DEH25_06360 [Chloroflexi bacterium]|nr:hypothetical protein [Chloroflexota bacterium]